MATKEKNLEIKKEEKPDFTSFVDQQSHNNEQNNSFPFSSLNGVGYQGISSQTERGTYRNVREYADCLGNWLYQYRLWMALSTFQSALIASMPPTPQNLAPNFAGFPVPEQNSPFRSETHRAASVGQNFTVGHRAENQYRIPSLWKRVAAEFLDFVLLFYTKLLVTFAFLKQTGFVQENLFELDTQIPFFYDISELDYDKMFTLTSELIALEVINRTCITIVETLCIQRGYAGSIGGATPGKKIMNLRVVACDEIRDLGNRHVILEGARDPGLLKDSPLTSDACEKVVSGLERKLCQFWCEKARYHMSRCTDCCDMALAVETASTSNLNLKTDRTVAFLRSMIKNFSMAFFFPACFTVFLFRFHRAAYDVLTHTVVVEIDQLANQQHRH